MRKKTYLALVMAAILVFAPAMSQIAMAEEGEGSAAPLSGEIATVSAGDAEQGGTGGDNQPEAEGKIPLPVPTGVAWGENWSPTWNPVAESEGWYHYEVYKDGELFYYAYGPIYTVEQNASNQPQMQTSFAKEINESGIYALRVRSYADRWDDEAPDTYVNSDWSEFVTKEYVRPEKALGNTVGYWSDTNPGFFCFSSVEGAGGYLEEVYFTPQGSDEERLINTSWGVTPNVSEPYGILHTEDMNGIYIETRGAGKYRIKIMALSGNLDEIANGSLGEFSGYYDTTVTTANVEDLLSDAMSNAATKEEARNKIKDTIDKSVLRTSMQIDDTVLNQIKDLESGYIAEKNITVEKPSVSAEASAYVNASDISVVGAGLNAAAGNKVGLEVSVPDENARVPSEYYKSVQLEIRLTRDGESVHELDIPITITMPVPEGINVSRLVILHYHEDGSYEIVNMRDNKDGTVTFTVDRFSTFAFVEDSSDDSEPANPGNTEPAAPGNTGNNNASSVSNSSTELKERIINVDWDAVRSTIAAAQQAGEENANVLAGTRYTVPASIISMLAGKNTALMLHGGNGLAVSIQGKDVRSAASDLKIDFSFDNVIPNEISRQVTDRAILSCAFSMTDKKSLPFKVDVHLNLGYENAGKYATLYYYDEVRKVMRYAGSYLITDAGQAMFAVTRGDEYIVVVTANSGNYTVVPGDTLSAIARRYGVSLRDVVKMNPQIANPNRIYPGQNIIIP